MDTNLPLSPVLHSDSVYLVTMRIVLLPPGKTHTLSGRAGAVVLVAAVSCDGADGPTQSCEAMISMTLSSHVLRVIS